MKGQLSGVMGVIGSVILIVFLLGAFQLRPDVSFASAPSLASSDQAYPPPQEDLRSVIMEESSDPYPVPGEMFNLTQTDDCSQAGTWIEYVNSKAGFSFHYPAESIIHESVNSNGYVNVSFDLKPYCYTTEWWGPKLVTIGALENRAMLTLHDFVYSQFNYDGSSSNPELSQELLESSEDIFVDQITALRVNGKITRETPHVYIPYNDLIIVVGLVETTFMPPFEPSCPTILDLFNNILASVKFQNH